MDQSAQILQQGSQPVQNQPVLTSQPQIANTPPGIKNKLPAFSSRPKIAVIAAVISAVLLIAILASFIVPGYLSKRKALPSASPEPSTDFSKMPENNLLSANGQILAIFPKEQKLSIKSSNPRPDGTYVTWTVTVDSGTILAKFADWTKANSGESTFGAKLPKTDAEIKAQLARIRLDSFKVGDSVYLMAKQGQDLATMEEIKGPSVLLLQ